MPVTADAKTKSAKRKERVLRPYHAGMVVHLTPSTRMNRDQLLRFCVANGELRIEQTAAGDLIIMAPVGYEEGRRNFQLYKPFADWEASVGGGECADCSAGFILPNGAMRFPDVSWVRREQLECLSDKQREGFLPLCPDFVLELRSRTDRLPVLRKKMAEYIDNGARLGWLIDPIEKQVLVYRPGEPVEHLKFPATLSGEPVLAGFTLDLSRVW